MIRAMLLPVMVQAAVVGLAIVLAAAPTHAQSLADELRRADRAMQRDTPRQTRPLASFEAIAREAGAAFRRGDRQAALDRFDEAAAEAFRVEATGAAFEYALAAAELTRAAGDHADAARRFRRAALSAVRDPRAAAAHEAGCLAAAEAFRADGSAKAMSYYGELLAEHLATWPRGASAAEIGARRRDWLLLSGDWRSLLAEPPAPSPDGPSIDRRLQAYRLAFAEPIDAADYATLLATATDELQPMVLTDARRWPKRWTVWQRDAALLLARGHLARGRPGAEYARQMLRVAWRGSPRASDDWRRRAGPALIVSSLAAEDRETAKAVRSQLLRGELIELTVVERQLATNAPDRWPAIAERLAATPQPVESSRRSVEEPEADTLAAWTERERNAPRNSGEWRRARLARIRRLHADGHTDDARKLLRLTWLLAGEGDEAWRASLDAAHASLRQE
ncbi:MAG: hypothetical protein AAFV43_14635 [Planctomycetota bacterium]